VASRGFYTNQCNSFFASLFLHYYVKYYYGSTSLLSKYLRFAEFSYFLSEEPWETGYTRFSIFLEKKKKKVPLSRTNISLPINSIYLLFVKTTLIRNPSLPYSILKVERGVKIRNGTPPLPFSAISGLFIYNQVMHKHILYLTLQCLFYSIFAMLMML